jgi:hypothetical protein
MNKKEIPLVLIESPYKGDNYVQFEQNVAYARACLRDSLLRGEAPFASHLLYTQAGVLDDKVLEERELGIESGLAWGRCADLTAVYTDLGTSEGMKRGIMHARELGRPVEYRSLYGHSPETWGTGN